MLEDGASIIFSQLQSEKEAKLQNEGKSCTV